MTEVDPDNEATYRVHTIKSDIREIRLPQAAVLKELQEHRFSAEAIFGIKLALEEALPNAIRHGNAAAAATTVTVRYATNPANAAVRRGPPVLTDRQKLRVRINPADLDALDAHKVSLLHDFAGIGTFDIEADASIKAGGCYVTSETMEADVTLETLLAEVLDTLAE